MEVSAAYEMIQSLVIVLDERHHETYEIGERWVDEMRERAGADLLKRLRAVAFDDADAFTHLHGLVYDTPAPRDVPAFLAHLAETDASEIKLHLVQFYSRDIRRETPPSVIRAAVNGEADAIAEFLRTSHPEWEPWTAYLRQVLAADGDALKRDLVDALNDWANHVWKPEAPTILPVLERDAEAKRELLRELPIEQFVTTATNGVEFAPRPGVQRVVMIPSVVNRPVVSFAEIGETFLIVYPVADESMNADGDAPPLRLVRLSKALGDEKRLRILRALADGEKTLMDLAEMFGVAKTTMHHHMIVLRSAGLVAVPVGGKRYRLRHEAVPDVGALLSGYLGAATGPSVASRPPAPAARAAEGR
jgi:DNA-binding transcriptional ArsR family regulator